MAVKLYKGRKSIIKVVHTTHPLHFEPSKAIQLLCVMDKLKVTIFYNLPICHLANFIYSNLHIFMHHGPGFSVSYFRKHTHAYSGQLKQTRINLNCFQKLLKNTCLRNLGQQLTRVTSWSHQFKVVNMVRKMLVNQLLVSRLN